MRTTHRRRVARPAVRPAPLALALALALGSPVALAGNTNVIDVTTLNLAIDAENANASAAGCAGDTITLAGGPFVVTPSTLIHTVICPHLVIQGNAPFPYGGTITTLSYVLPALVPAPFSDICGFTSAAPITVRNMEISGFTNSSRGRGLCGQFESVTGVHLVGNDYGVVLTSDSGIGAAGAAPNDIDSNLYAGIAVVYGGATIRNNTIHGNVDGIEVQSNATIGGTSNAERNIIAGQASAGIVVAGTATIVNNWIGTADGTTASSNGTGIHLSGGVAMTVADNLISGNFTGIQVSGTAASITGNLIGTDASGTSVLANQYGIVANNGSSAAIDNNVVAASSTGIAFYDGPTGSVTNNMIGVDKSGNTVLGPTADIGFYGGSINDNFTLSGNTIVAHLSDVQIQNATGGVISGNKLGTTSAGAPLSTTNFNLVAYCSSGLKIRNDTVSGGGPNLFGGSINAISLNGTQSSEISGNFIGVSFDGVTPLNNFGYGVLLDSHSCGGDFPDPPSNNLIMGNVISKLGESGIVFSSGGGTGNTISGNTISNNGRAGIEFDDNTAVGNAILDNVIFGNASKNIDLNTVDHTMPLLNDPGDVDTGANDNQNYPVVTNVLQDGTNTTVFFTLDTPIDVAHDYRVEFYTNPGPGTPAGQARLATGSAALTLTGVQAVQSFSQTFPGTLDNVSMTATLLAGGTPYETSEFSPAVASAGFPAVSVIPNAVNFGTIEAGASSADTTITLTSTGREPWTPSQITAAACPIPMRLRVKAAPGPLSCGSGFICSTDCITTPATSFNTNESCTVTARFAPGSLAPASSTLNICDNAGSSHTIQLSGSALAPPPLTVSPASFDFGNVVTGGASAPASFSVNNPAQSDVALGAATVTGPFSLGATTCGATLATGTSCAVTVAFNPTASARATGALSVPFTSSATGTSVTSNATASLAGTGVAAVALNLPASLDVGTYVIGLASAVRTISVTNSGTSAASISSIVASAPFTLTHTCPASLPAGGSCTLTVTLADINVGPANGSLTLTTPAGAQRVALTGIVAPPAVQLRPASFDFGAVPVKKQSDPVTFVVANTTKLDVPVAVPSISGPFTISSNSCGPLLGANGICSIDVRFAPAHGGPASGELDVNFGVNAKRALPKGVKASSPATAFASLSGSGIDAALLDMPSLVDFGVYIVGTPALVRTVTITSSGTAVITFDRIAVSGPFTLSHDCPLNLQPDQSCTLTITFNSSVLGNAAGAVAITSNAVGGLRTISLGALVQPVPAPIVSLSPISISFGDRLIATQSGSVRVTVQNTGGAAAILGPMTASPDYVIVGTSCTTTLAPQASCTVDIAMLPVGFGPRPGTLAFTSNADGSPHSVSLNGAGCRPFAIGSNRSASPPNCAP